MIKFYFSILSIFLTTGIIAQQIDNGNMEDWDDLGSSSEEPSNWNSFMSATGGLAFFGSQQVEQSSDVSSSSTGMYSARVFSKSTLGIIANGNLTLGRINMGSSTPSSPDNYNFSSTTDGDFSQALTTMPDSLDLWVKYNANSNSDSASVRATEHVRPDAAMEPVSPADATSDPQAREDRAPDLTADTKGGFESNMTYDGSATNYSVAHFEKVISDANAELLGCNTGWSRYLDWHVAVYCEAPLSLDKIGPKLCTAGHGFHAHIPVIMSSVAPIILLGVAEVVDELNGFPPSTWIVLGLVFRSPCADSILLACARCRASCWNAAARRSNSSSSTTSRASTP